MGSGSLKMITGLSSQIQNVNLGWMLSWVSLPCRCTRMHTGSSVHMNEDGGPAVPPQVTRSLSSGLRFTGCVLCLLQLQLHHFFQPLPAGRVPLPPLDALETRDLILSSQTP